MTDPFLWVISFCMFEMIKEVLFFHLYKNLKDPSPSAKFFVFLKNCYITQKKHGDSVVPWRYIIIYTECSAVALPKALQNILAIHNNGTMEYEELLHRSGATKTTELLHGRRYRIYKVVTQEAL
jgi:hypothetical protein